jgi:hypothetical protein
MACPHRAAGRHHAQSLYSAPAGRGGSMTLSASLRKSRKITYPDYPSGRHADCLRPRSCNRQSHSLLQWLLRFSCSTPESGMYLGAGPVERRLVGWPARPGKRHAKPGHAMEFGHARPPVVVDGFVIACRSGAAYLRCAKRVASCFFARAPMGSSARLTSWSWLSARSFGEPVFERVRLQWAPVLLHP